MPIVNLKIEDVAFGGKGVARDNGKAIFVPYTIDGETVQADIVREKKKFGEAELVEVIEASPERVRPECPYFGKCGGCAYQHITYPHQLELKWRQVRDLLQRIGKLTDIPMRPMIASPASYRYRNRITVHVEDGVIGFFRRDSNRLIDIEHCPISRDEVNNDLARLRQARPRDGHYALPAERGPRIFSQTNDVVADLLCKVIDAAIPSGQDLLIDAFCGAGFFAKRLLDKFERIIGIDWDRFAIDEARKDANAKETYIAGDVGAELKKLHSPALNRLEPPNSDSPIRTGLTMVVDPPGTGLTNETRETILALNPEHLIYISCNPATLARDLAELGQKLSIKSVTPADMFPQTAEIETVVHLQA